MHTVPITNNRPNPLTTNQTWLKKFNVAVGSTNKDDQARLIKEMKLNYHGGVGKLIWAVTTCCPDLAYVSVKLLQSNLYSHEYFLYFSYRRNPMGKECLFPPEPYSGSAVISNCQDLLLDFNSSKFNARMTHIYSNSNWATCVKTCCSFTGCCMCLAGGTIAYKTKFQPTVALSLTEAKFMAACDAGKMSLYIRSILWDLHVPQEAATITYEDNNACTAMANAQ
jgi:hypothetical protein